MKKLNNSFGIALLFLSSVALARPVAQVVEIKGQVFGVLEGKTKALRVNDHIEDKTEVMVGEEGSVTLNDYYDASYHLIDGSHIKFMDKSVLLKNGKTWIQSTNSRHPLSLTTANGSADFWKAEFIATFDQSNSRTQFLVVNGDLDISNLWDKNFKYSVPGGHFSFIDPKVENGVPRTPTKVGFDSLNAAMIEFKSLPQHLKNESPVREIASVPGTEAATGQPKKGQIIFMNSGRLPASAASGQAQKYFIKKVAKKKIVKLSSAPISYYGLVPQEIPVESPVEKQISEINNSQKQDLSPRTPASVPRQELNLPTKVAPQLNIEPDYSESLRKHYGEQPKYSKEVENLLEDLKSF
jgi:hypothetical protein